MGLGRSHSPTFPGNLTGAYPSWDSFRPKPLAYLEEIYPAKVREIVQDSLKCVVLLWGNTPIFPEVRMASHPHGRSKGLILQILPKALSKTAS